jgi:hypothetical protein
VAWPRTPRSTNLALSLGECDTTTGDDNDALEAVGASVMYRALTN